MPNLLRIGVENPDELLNAGAYDAGALVRIQSSATQAGVYADLTGTGSTPTIALVSGTHAYLGYDPAGVAATWYRTRYENAAATRLSDWSTTFQVGSAYLCELNDAKQRLGIEDGDHSEDENLLQFIEQVTYDIQGYTGRQFIPDPASGDGVFTFDVWPQAASDGSSWVSRDGKCLHIPKGIRSITTLKVASATGATLTAVTDFYLRPLPQDREYGWPATALYFSDVGGSYFYPGFGTVELTGQMGWAAPPPDVVDVALQLVAQKHQSRAAPGFGDSFTVNIDGSRVYHWNRAVFGVLNRYRVPLVL